MRIYYLYGPNKCKDKKTEVMVFANSTKTANVHLKSLVQYNKPICHKHGVKVNTELKFDSQIKAVVKSSFF